MQWNLLFFANSALLGVGLAMDAFSVSLANGLHEPDMRRGRICVIAGVFAFFQFLMPMVGWVCVHTVSQHFAAFSRFIPYIALALLVFIGGQMLLEGRPYSPKNPAEARKAGVTAFCRTTISSAFLLKNSIDAGLYAKSGTPASECPFMART